VSEGGMANGWQSIWH